MSSAKKTDGSPHKEEIPRGDIGLGDLIRALDKLDTRDPNTMARITRALGFTGIAPDPVGAAKGASGAKHRPQLTKTAPPKRQPHHGGIPEIAPPIELPEQVLDTELTPAEPLAPSERPEWLDEGTGLESSAAEAVPRAQLFPERSAKGVLTASVATRRAGPHPDIDRLIRAIVRGDVFRTLPYRQVPSVHRGLQLLMDTSESMTPFLEDLDDLARALLRIVGNDNCQLYQFEGNPHRAARWSQSFEEIPWRPIAGCPVVIATDFGIGARIAARDRVSPRSWLDFERRARAAGAPVVAFVPYGRERWPTALSRRIHLIHWDQRTRASHITKLFGCGHEVDP